MSAISRHLGLGLVGVLLVACGQLSVTSSPMPTPRVPSGVIDITGSGGLTWLDARKIVVSRPRDATDVASPHDLAIVDTVSGNWEEMPLPSLDGCQRTDYLRPQRLVDGRIGAIRRCIPSDLQSGGDWPTWLIAVDPTTLEVEELTPNLSTGTVVNISSYAWDPNLKMAIVSEGSRVCQTLQAVDDSGMSPIDLLVTVDGKSFNLNDAPSGDCSATGQADDPTIAPDGSAFAFTASAAAIGVSGPSRFDAPSSLLLQRADADGQQSLVAGIKDAFGVRYSPDGRCIGMGADIKGEGEGTYVVDPSNGKVAKVSDVAIGASWSIGGDQLAGGVLEGLGSEAKEWLVVIPASCAALD